MLKSASRVVLCVALFITPAAFAADHGLFMVVKGSVKILSKADNKESTAKVGSKVFSGDTIITEKDSRAKIVMSDRNVLQLSPDSRFEITNYKTGATENDREVQVALMQGKVRVQVEQKYGEKNKFELKTPTAVAGVRGTQYVAQYNPKTLSTVIMVLNGRVSVGSIKTPNAAVMVNPSMGTTVGQSGPPLPPTRVSAAELNSFSDMNSSAGKGPNGASNSENGSGESMVTKEDTQFKENGGDAKAESSGPSVRQPPPPPPPPPRPNPVATAAAQTGATKTKVIVTPKPQ